MKMSIYAIFDSAVKTYSRPMFLNTDNEAIRSFQSECNRVGSVINAHPDQFTLFNIGEYDDNTSLIKSSEPRSLGNAVQYKDTRGELFERASALYEDLRKYFGDK